MAGLKKHISQQGLAPYGPRHGSLSVKGRGYFGEIDTPEGKPMTELSTESEAIGEHPLVVPTMTKSELKALAAGDEPTDRMYEKAERWANERKAAGKSPFAQPGELRYPTPKLKKGGVVNSKPTKARGCGIAKRGLTKGKVR